MRVTVSTIVLVVLCFAQYGCSETLVLSIRDGTAVVRLPVDDGPAVQFASHGPASIEGTISASTARTLTVTDASSGLEYVIERTDINEIDYPGTVLTTVGGVLTGLGAVAGSLVVYFAVEASRGTKWAGWGAAFSAVPAVPLLVTGIPLLYVGLDTWLSALDSVERADWQLTPAAVTDGEQTAYGAGLIVRF